MQVEYLSNIIECRKVKVWGRSGESVGKYIKDMASENWEVKRAIKTDEIAETCDLIITTTPSKTPLLKKDNLKKGTLIIAVGSDSPGKQELDEKILQHADYIVADSIVQCIDRGEISHGIKNKIINQEKIAELGNLIGNKKDFSCGDNQIIVADLTGVAVQDIQIAKAVFKACERLD